jgi:CPA2 family monovalent cation:H+ antiporter-2
LRARAANPKIGVIARTHSDAEADHLNSLGADTVIMGEREIARGMIAHSFCPESSPAVSTTSEPERRP